MTRRTTKRKLTTTRNHPEPSFGVYVPQTFHGRSWERIGEANDIISEFAQQGFRLTLRQLFYQFVARDLIPNTHAEYRKLLNLVRNARLAGYISMDAIEDRTRSVERLSTWESPRNILETAAETFRFDKWRDQSTKVEVWYEKDALSGVFEAACAEYEIPHVSTRGYSSLSLLREAELRFLKYRQPLEDNYIYTSKILVLHFADHDPSGLDMSVDLEGRLERDFMLGLYGVCVERIGLTLEQVEEHNPPPNYAKVTDSRFSSYIDEAGTDECWELDALSPQVLAKLVQEQVEEHLDKEKWKKALDREKKARKALANVAKDFKEA
jgi:hypothetical protein